MRRNNKGFSLVELLVSFAILGLVTVSVSVMMVSGSNMFASNKKVLELQYKSQVASAQVYEYIKQCDGVMAYSASDGVIAVAKPDKNDDTKADFYIITKDGSEDQLYLYVIPVTRTKNDGSYEYKIDDTDSIDSFNLNSYEKYRQPLCSDFDGLSIVSEKTSGSAEKKLISSLNFKMDFKAKNKTYSKTTSVSLRNKPIYIATESGSINYTAVIPNIWG